MLTILQQIILGAVQGITEWIPISSSAALVLIMTNFFGITNLETLITTALFFHLGTFFAALIYFRKEVFHLSGKIFNYKEANIEDKKVLQFIIVTTLISGILGIIFLKLLENFAQIEFTGKTISFAIGILLLITGMLQLKPKLSSLKTAKDIKQSDSWLLGVAQGFSVLPGISRSGITVSALLLRKFNDTTALKLSFLMSLPIVLAGNILLNLNDLVFTSTAIYGLLASFVFGILTIHVLMKMSKKINFGWFVIFFAILMMLSVLI
ncbi:MAG: undecaprenyl-diphosphate phosphatase [Nanoarchaeota archaeon]|nr:undecaprenyl-diphosphate phosphatase [Nanoarchaeota archaeon]